VSLIVRPLRVFLTGIPGTKSVSATRFLVTAPAIARFLDCVTVAATSGSGTAAPARFRGALVLAGMRGAVEINRRPNKQIVDIGKLAAISWAR